jgi:hypothetical protein
MRQSLIEADLPNVCVLTAGGRWVSEVEIELPEPSAVELEPLQGTNSARESGSWRVSTPSESNHAHSPVLEQERDAAGATLLHGPSEPLRKALAAETFAQPTTSAETEIGWGPGLYVEKDAIEQLGKNLKNAPTPLHVLSATFYRIGG